ncbi:MAG TPA: hypothetical protein PLK30_21755 [Blastocatellia bacterium]|nr:hypothetical protein [Blastocatellia bacterium]
MTRLKIAIQVLLFGVCLSVTSFAQVSPEAKSVCEKSPNAIQISFAHIETLGVVNGRPINVLWLRLHNNSYCWIEIKVPAEFLQRTFPRPRIARDENGQFIKNANGGLQIERLAKVKFKNGDKVKVIYHLSNSRFKSIGGGNFEGCVVESVTMQPGQEFLFPVDSPAFKKNHFLEVMFSYVSEISVRREPLLGHKTIFAFNDIPQEAIKAFK